MTNITDTKIDPCYGDRVYETIEALMEGVKCGDLLAAYDLAQHYENGVVIPQDFNKAAELYKLVSECREALVFADPDMPLTPQCEAEYAIGCLYEKGLLTDSSMEKAIHWFRRSVDSGGSDASFRMAELYIEGLYVERDYDIAAKYLYYGYNAYGCYKSKLFTIASELYGKSNNYLESILEVLVWCYSKGIGVEKDENKASLYNEELERARSENMTKTEEWYKELMKRIISL